MGLKFKIGDRVRCKLHDVKTYGGAGWENNMEFIIGKGNEYQDINNNVYFPDGEMRGIFEDFLELISSEPNYEVY